MNRPFSNIKKYALNDKECTLSNDSSICILVLEANYQDPEKELLANILKAINLSVDTINLVVVKENTAWGSKLIRSSAIDTLISFGFDAKQTGFNIHNTPTYKWLYLEDAKILFCDALTQINGDKNLKMALWGQLQILKKV